MFRWVHVCELPLLVRFLLRRNERIVPSGIMHTMISTVSYNDIASTHKFLDFNDWFPSLMLDHYNITMNDFVTEATGLQAISNPLHRGSGMTRDAYSEIHTILGIELVVPVECNLKTLTRIDYCQGRFGNSYCETVFRSVKPVYKVFLLYNQAVTIQGIVHDTRSFSI